MLKRNKERGVTLIALVVTIIVLLILAGISIAMLTGDNGILTNAQKAKIETRGAAVEEARNIWKATKETDKLANSSTAKTLEELIDDLVKQKQLTEEEKDIILGNEEKGIEAKYKVTIGSRTIEFTKMITFHIKNYDDGYIDNPMNTYSGEHVVLESTTFEEFFVEKFGDYFNNDEFPDNGTWRFIDGKLGINEGYTAATPYGRYLTDSNDNYVAMSDEITESTYFWGYGWP